MRWPFQGEFQFLPEDAEIPRRLNQPLAQTHNPRFRMATRASERNRRRIAAAAEDTEVSASEEPAAMAIAGSGSSVRTAHAATLVVRRVARVRVSR